MKAYSSKIRRTYYGSDRCVEIDCQKYGTVELLYRGDKINFRASSLEMPSVDPRAKRERYILFHVELDNPDRKQKRRIIKNMFECLQHCKQKLK